MNIEINDNVDVSNSCFKEVMELLKASEIKIPSTVKIIKSIKQDYKFFIYIRSFYFISNGVSIENDQFYSDLENLFTLCNIKFLCNSVGVWFYENNEYD